MEKADIEKLLKESLTSINLPNKTTITCQVDKSCRVQFTDSILLRRILSNLISNSIQAMPNGGKINIQAFTEDSAAIITISDTGSGIPDEIKPKLFMPLMTTKSKSQGFGLAVVKHMTEALGGTVTFESQIGVGAKFTLRYPLKNALDRDFLL